MVQGKWGPFALTGESCDTPDDGAALVKLVAAIPRLALLVRVAIRLLALLARVAQARALSIQGRFLRYWHRLYL
jgi:hypothetical protein